LSWAKFATRNPRAGEVLQDSNMRPKLRRLVFPVHLISIGMCFLRQADWLAHLGTGGPKYTEYAMGSHSLLETLYRVPSCKPDVGHLFEALPHLQPRMYSLSSSPEYHLGQAHITVAEVSD
jgi:hypothetical protein